MSNRWFLTALITVAVAGCSQMRMGHKEDKEESADKIQWTQVPPAVQQTLTREAKGATIDTVDKEMRDGKTVYEADAMVDGKNWEIVVGEDGNVVDKKLDPENEEDEKPAAGKKDDKD